MKKRDFIFWFIFIIILSISLFYLHQSSYAKYRKKVNGNLDANLASWNIVLNDESIIGKQVLSNYITPIFDSNDYVEDGYLAPGVSGYFDIFIDASSVDVDFDYEIYPSAVNLDDLLVTEYEIDGVTYSYNDQDKITGSINKRADVQSIRLYFKWNDDIDNSMNNEEDTSFAFNPNNAITKMKLEMRFIQKQ